MRSKASLFIVGFLALATMLGIPAHASPAASPVAIHPIAIEAAVTGPYVITVKPGDTYGEWAKQYCGNFNSWTTIQLDNGWPERKIPIGATATINCASANAPKPNAEPAKPANANPSSGWVHPLASNVHGSSCYGWRASSNSMHRGVDLRANGGTPIRAAAAGTVYLKQYQAGGAGYYVVIKHPGNIFTVYMHMPGHSPLAIGTPVSAGQTIGKVGASGNATGPHLHFEVHTGLWTRTNPATFMRDRGVNIGC